MRIASLFLLFWTVVLLIVSCQSVPYYTQSLDLVDGKWDNSEELLGTFNIVDTVLYYDLYLDIDHSNDYYYENIYLQIETQFPHKESISQVLPVNIADKKGKWHGKCSGDHCKLRVVLREATRFDAIGDYTLVINQHSRKNSLTGINKLELLVVESER